MVLVALFGSVWFGTRLVIFPLHIIKNCYKDSLQIFAEEGIDGEVGGIFYLLVGCLSFLCVLHAIWFYKIVLLVVRVAKGETVKDNRSDSEDAEDEDEDEKEDR